MEQTQQIRRINNTEVTLPAERTGQHGVHLASISPTTPMDMAPEAFTQALNRREDNRKALLRWIQSNLQTGIDFGQIHVFGKDKCRLAREGRAYDCSDPRHWSKPSLWKPGAEKICGMLGLIPRFPNLNEYENAVLRGDDLKLILLKCELNTGSGFVAAEGTGARRVAQDYGDINKSLKMAEKSAHIDATLRVAGLSELFTQDLEDMVNGPKETFQPTPSGADREHSKPEPGGQQPAYGNGRNGNAHRDNGNGGNRITGKQYKFIMDLMQESGMTKKDLNDRCVQVYGSVVDHINRNDASSLIDWLRNQ